MRKKKKKTQFTTCMHTCPWVHSRARGWRLKRQNYSLAQFCWSEGRSPFRMHWFFFQGTADTHKNLNFQILAFQGVETPVLSSVRHGPGESCMHLRTISYSGWKWNTLLYTHGDIVQGSQQKNYSLSWYVTYCDNSYRILGLHFQSCTTSPNIFDFCSSIFLSA